MRHPLTARLWCRAALTSIHTALLLRSRFNGAALTEPPHFEPVLFAVFAPSDAVFVITFSPPNTTPLPPLTLHHDRFRPDLERIQQQPHFLLGCFLGFHSFQACPLPQHHCTVVAL